MSPMGAELEGRTALVTGGGRGLGRAIALHLARAGAGIALVARTRSQLDESAAMIDSEGGRALAIVADVTERSEVEAGVAEVGTQARPDLDTGQQRWSGAALRPGRSRRPR